MDTVIVYGPPASGKTRNAEALRKMYGCKGINDQGVVIHTQWHIKYGYLNLVQQKPKGLPAGTRLVYIEDALRELRQHLGASS